ncbi:3-deoxy-7-phosphoheptulonate synthase [Candidatus Uhrbacteria bacterium]|nr:3-deoxy-7-phosphoheptulonate synthase [Candidatus Uhrbacteria bacterium]
MNISLIKKLPSADEIISRSPLSAAGHSQIARDRQEVKDILAGKDKRLLLIMGPCSAWPHEAVIEYAKRLKRASEPHRDKFKVVLRLYIQKPRTTKGWTGPVNQPDPFLPPDIEKGIEYSRRLMVEVIELGLPIADEAVFTHNARGFIELLSWVAIGARSTEDQEHRIFASAVDCAAGMKNPTSGALDIAGNSIIAAQHPHTAVLDGYQIETGGNEYAHLVLRGGADGPNYAEPHIIRAAEILNKNLVKNPSIIIDASHDNCKVNGVKNPSQQIEVVRSVLLTIARNENARNIVKGFMLESFLQNGAQKVESCSPETIDWNGLSITDPCISWEETEMVLNEIADRLA